MDAVCYGREYTGAPKIGTFFRYGGNSDDSAKPHYTGPVVFFPWCNEEAGEGKGLGGWVMARADWD